MQIREDDLSGIAVAALLREHLANMHDVTPPQSIHALDLEALRAPQVSVWTAWDGEQLLGCGALKELDAHHGEIKSMRTADAYRGLGVGTKMLRHIVAVARRRDYRILYLETGAMAAFAPARALYAGFGFDYCGPFADYEDDPNSVYMHLRL